MSSGWIGSGGAKVRFVHKESLPPLGGRISTSTYFYLFSGSLQLREYDLLSFLPPLMALRLELNSRKMFSTAITRDGNAIIKDRRQY
jgi:hypothetical protein